MLELIRTMHKRKNIDLSLVSRNSRRLLHSANSHFLVAETNKTIVGFAHFTTRKTILHQGPSGLIDELVVAKDCRRVGTGRRLLSATIQKCRELRCCEIEVSTEKTNRKAREFYKSSGFEERGELLEMDLVP
jgi:ribosomal protein S18 acetylase RimI-like enzyme